VVGRKGSKSHLAELGSNALQALSLLHYPIIVIKRPLPDGPLRYLYAVNGSMQSKSGLDILLKIVKPRDTLILLHVMDSETPDVDGYLPDMKAYYERELAEYGPPNSSLRIFMKERGMAITSALVNYAEEDNPDFFVIAPRSKISVSSITEYIINHVSMSVVLCKI
jgi:nucleotide-binding universal stress UspA family protein